MAGSERSSDFVITASLWVTATQLQQQRRFRFRHEATHSQALKSVIFVSVAVRRLTKVLLLHKPTERIIRLQLQGRRLRLESTFHGDGCWNVHSFVPALLSFTSSCLPMSGLCSFGRCFVLSAAASFIHSFSGCSQHNQRTGEFSRNIALGSMSPASICVFHNTGLQAMTIYFWRVGAHRNGENVNPTTTCEYPQQRKRNKIK